MPTLRRPGCADRRHAVINDDRRRAACSGGGLVFRPRRRRGPGWGVGVHRGACFVVAGAPNQARAQSARQTTATIVAAATAVVHSRGVEVRGWRWGRLSFAKDMTGGQQIWSPWYGDVIQSRGLQAYPFGIASAYLVRSRASVCVYFREYFEAHFHKAKSRIWVLFGYEMSLTVGRTN